MTHRFINADGYVSTGTGILGHNMFAYCNNNPINCKDVTGSKAIRDIQVDITNGDTTYNIMDVTRMQMANQAGITDSGKNVYIVPNSSYNVPAGDNVVVVDYRLWSDPNMQIRNSYLITDFAEMRDIADILLKYNENDPLDPLWNRTVDSIVVEWDAHNDLNDIREHERLKHVDLNNADEGTSYIEFVIRAGKEVVKSAFK